MPEPGEPETAQRAAVADVVEKHHHEIESRWLAAVRSDLGHRSLDLTELRDAMPDYLRALARELRAEAAASTIEMRGNAAWVPVAKEHAVTRVRQGFDIEELVHEFIVLRRILFEVAREHGLGSNELHSSGLADLVEAGLATSVKSYVESRDYAARRVEAEHIAFVTHELKTPLTAAHLIADRLRTELRLTDAQQKQFELLLRNMKRLGELIDGVLLVEQFDADRTKVDMATVPLATLLTAPIESARAVAGAKGIELDVDCAPGLLVEADANLTMSAIGNLVDNAVKYTDEGTVRVCCEDAGENVEIHVHDNCPGLSDEELRTIFEPFRRGHRPTKPGTGLGLAIAKRAVEAQGGRIGAESPGDRGCHFWFTLPKAAG